MAVFELRTYQVVVGKMKDALSAYNNKGWPALQKGGYDKKLVGYFISDTGVLHQIIHLWKFDDDADRRNHWDSLFSNDDFMSFASELRYCFITKTNYSTLRLGGRIPKSWDDHGIKELDFSVVKLKLFI